MWQVLEYLWDIFRLTNGAHICHLQMTLKFVSLLCGWFCAIPSCCIVTARRLYDPCRTLDSFWKNFQASVFLAIFLRPLTPIFFKSFSTSSNHLFLGFPTGLFPAGIFLNTFFAVLSSDILSTYPTHHTFPFLISEIMSDSLYTSVNSFLLRIPHTPLFVLGQIFVSILYFYNIS